MKITFTLEELEELVRQAGVDAQIGGRDQYDSFNMGCRTAVSNMMAKLNTAYSEKVMANVAAEMEAM